MKLALGTAQIGLHYGTFNREGQIKFGEAKSILDYASAAGIDTIDTARAYGNSEDVLGSLRAAQRFRVVTKISSLGHSKDKAGAVEEQIARSKAALCAESLDTVLFHSAEDLLGDQANLCWNQAERAQADGTVVRLGVSVYDAVQALAIAERFPIKVVQLPVSVFDQRAIANGALAKLKAQGIEVHARSVFLQGFALCDPDNLPFSLMQFRPVLTTFRAFADGKGISPLAAALGFVRLQPYVDRVVVGVQSAKELEEICRASYQLLDLAGADVVASTEQQLLNPGMWA